MAKKFRPWKAWREQTVSIRVEKPAKTIGRWAVHERHRSWSPNGYSIGEILEARKRSNWTLTYIPSGMAVCFFDTEAAAMDVAQRAHRALRDVPDGDMGCSALARDFFREYQSE